MTQGHNNPPSPIDYAREVVREVSLWMSEHPVIQSEDEAREAKRAIDRVVAALKDVELERTSKVKPLNDQVSAINAEYKAVHDAGARRGRAGGTFDRVLDELRQRVEGFMLIEEAKRQRAAEEARQAAEALRAAAIAAEEKEKAAVEEASGGILDVDIAGATEEADAAFAEFQRADRGAARAERDAKVRLGGGFGRALTIKEVEVLAVIDWAAAIRVMGLTDHIRDAILTSARAFRKVYDELPEGVEAQKERRI